MVSEKICTAVRKQEVSDERNYQGIPLNDFEALGDIKTEGRITSKEPKNQVVLEQICIISPQCIPQNMEHIEVHTTIRTLKAPPQTLSNLPS